jgi:arylsulfatase A-like enzyme
MARKPTDGVQLKLRFSEALRRRLEREAKRQERSMNAEIIHRIEQSFQKEDSMEQARRAGMEVMERTHKEYMGLIKRTNRQFADLFLRLHDSGISNEDLKVALDRWLGETEKESQG